MDVKDKEMDEVPDMGIPEESNYSNTTDPIPIHHAEVALGAEHLYNLIVSSTSPVMDWIYLASHYYKSWSYRIQEKDEDAGESKADCYEVQKV